MNTIRAGRIRGNPANGLCERVCIEVPRVFDGCRERIASQPVALTLTDIPAQATPPFTFVRAMSLGESAFAAHSVTDGSCGKSCVRGDVQIPLSVTFTDTFGNAYAARSELTLSRTFSLCLPQEAIEPYFVKVAAAFRSEHGAFLNENTVSANGCLVLVAKAVVNVDLLVPSYGYCVYPTCSGCGEDVCTQLDSLPLFP